METDDTQMTRGPGEANGGPDRNSPFDWYNVISVLWSARKMISLVTGVFTLLAVVVSFVLPESYRSSTTLLPETEKGKLGMLGGLSDLAALAGLSMGGDASLVKLYPAIIQSEAVLRNVIYTHYETTQFTQPVDLVHYWGIETESRPKEFEAALKTLLGRLDVSMENRTSIVTISVESEEPQLSADIANNIAKELDVFIRTKRTTNASEQRKWIEERLAGVKKDLDKSEDNLKGFREKNRRVGDSPQLLLEQGRLAREVEINSTLYVELKKQYEVVKIEEIKNIPIINVMDRARPAVQREKPKRRTIVVTIFILSFLASAGTVVALDRNRQFVKKTRDLLKKLGGGDPTVG